MKPFYYNRLKYQIGKFFFEDELCYVLEKQTLTLMKKQKTPKNQVPNYRRCRHKFLVSRFWHIDRGTPGFFSQDIYKQRSQVNLDEYHTILFACNKHITLHDNLCSQDPHIQYKSETRKRYTLSIALLSNKHITVEPPLSGLPSINWPVIKIANNNN